MLNYSSHYANWIVISANHMSVQVESGWKRLLEKWTLKTREKIFFNLDCDHGSIRNRFLINKQGLKGTHRVGKCPNDLKDI